MPGLAKACNPRLNIGKGAIYGHRILALMGTKRTCSQCSRFPHRYKLSLTFSQLYSLSWLISTLIAGLVYWLLHKLSPMPISEDSGEVLEGIESRTDSEVEQDPTKNKAFDS
ncbi:hypothetical protein LTS10_008115 [Elasticomyces elasticus]|nr:hypothetical protein LTS10_008115 [Elasticomyces elasticus]